MRRFQDAISSIHRMHGQYMLFKGMVLCQKPIANLQASGGRHALHTKAPLVGIAPTTFRLGGGRSG